MSDVVVRSGVPTMDDCRILTRLKAFVVDQGVPVTLEHVFRDAAGNPKDLSAWLGGSTDSDSVSSSAPGVVKLRVKEWLGTYGQAKIWEAAGQGVDADKGVISADIGTGIVARAGIYELNWAVTVDSRPVAIDRGILSVERSLFPASLDVAAADLGPPTLQEVRMRMMDSSRSENVLLDDIEFKDEQVLLALAEPVRYWNESLPPLRKFTTFDFPYRGMWITGVMGQLLITAAGNYRRNVLKASDGSDKDKEREYMAEGVRLWTEFKAQVANVKTAINLRLFCGQSLSAYSHFGG